MEVFIILIILPLIHGADILGIFNHPAKSHTSLGVVLFEELARLGHNVVFVNGYPSKSSHENYTNIMIAGIAEDILDRDMIYFDHKNNQRQIIKESIDMSLSHMTATFENEQVKEMIRTNKTFDLVIVDFFYNDANLIFGHIFDAPTIVMSSFGNVLETTRFSGNELPLSYVPGCSLQIGDRMTFWERLEMAVSSGILLWTLRESKRKHTDLLEKYYGDVPDIEELYRNVSLVLANSHYSFESPRPSTPNIIPIGGFHIKERVVLDKELEALMDNSNDGVIYFSLGSQIKSSNMKNETISAITEAFAGFNVLVLWKFERKFGISLPDNVVIRNWFPQSDVLSHPNMKLFITHGGLLSFIESVNYGVPMLAIPFNGDQNLNAKFIESRDLGKVLNLEDISKETMVDYVRELLNNPKYRINSKQYSELLRNQPIKPLEKAIFWIEHVIAHKGADHLKPSSLNLSWYEYYMLDVYSFLAAVIILLLIIVDLIVYVTLSRFGYFK